jgi:hypothetical protein
LGQSFTVLNVYGFYDNKQSFKNCLFQLEVFNEGIVVLRGDLNFTLNRLKVLEESVGVDRHFDYFLRHLEVDGLIDVES